MQKQNAGPTYQGKRRTCGFRLSGTDILVLVLGTAAGTLGYFYTGALALFIPYVVGHFFLFCNVFRVRRKPELVWATAFLANCLIWNAIGELNVYGIFASQFLLTIVVILNEMRSPHYHGVLSRQINPRIDDYLAGRT